MYQQYDEISMHILNKMKAEGKGKSSVSTTRTSIQKLRTYMQGNGFLYTPEIAAEWLEKEIRPITNHESYKQIRFVHYRIAIIFDSGRNLRELFYKDLQSNYDRLPLWAQDVISGFLGHYKTKQKCTALFKAGASTFMLHQIKNGLDSTSSLSYGSCADYYRKYGPVIGIGRFLFYLKSQGMISPYVQYSYHYQFSKRILEIPLDTPLREAREGYSLREYKIAQDKAYKALNSKGYSKTVKKAFLSASNEFGVFLGFNGLSYSEETVVVFVENFRKTISPNIDAIRRSLLSIGYFLRHEGENYIPLVFPKKLPRLVPAWAEQEVSCYKAIRERAGKSRSTLNMDRSSLTKFLIFLDADGCDNFHDISAERIKSFNTQDRHATNGGKNAYNIRIRGFLRFLEGRCLVPKGISKALPPINDVKLRPAIVLSNDDQKNINGYCEEAEQTGKFLESAVLKIAMQTGLRGIDISKLRCDSIDWKSQEFTLIQQKTRKHIRLPFSNGVGNAILKYIEGERLVQQTPYLFISPRAPHGRLSNSQIKLIASKAVKRNSGTHIMRKTFASNLLQAGVGYDTVSDALGHDSPKTVDPYLSTNTASMRLCAIPLGDALQYKGGLL